MSRRRGKRRPATVATPGLTPAPIHVGPPAPAALAADPALAPAPAVSPAPTEPPRSRGAQVLDEARAFYGTYYHFTSSVQLDLFTLWCAGVTHLRSHDGTYLPPHAPICLIRASTSGAGKSLLATFIALTGGRGRILFAPMTTYWGVVRSISEDRETVVLDNYDEAKGAARDGQKNVLLATAYEDTGLLRSGKANERDAYVHGPAAVTCIGDRLRRADDFKPVAERSVVLDVAKTPKDVTMPRFDRRDEATKARARAIHAACSEWGMQIAPEVSSYRANHLVKIANDPRDVDMWEPIAGVARAAGGPWPARAERAFRVLVLNEPVPVDEDANPFANLTPAERSMIDASHVLREALDVAQLDALTAGEHAPSTVSLTTAELLARMSALPAGERWKLPAEDDPDERQRVMRARSMDLARDLGMFGVDRESVKVPANDGTGRYVQGWWSKDVLPHRPAELPFYRPSDLEAHTRAVEEEDVPFE